MYTDHKPLVPLINTKDLSDTPIRCQRMLIRMQRFSLTAVHRPGKEMLTSDTLSRSPISARNSSALQEDDIEMYVDSLKAGWPASDAYIDKIRTETKEDQCLQIALDYTLEGWPQHKEDVKLGARDLFAVRGELSAVDGILLWGNRIVIPHSMRKEVMEKIHEGHMGINKCRERARQSVRWPRITQDIKDRIQGCRFCLEKQPSQKKEPLLSLGLPDRPFHRYAVDICEIKNSHFLVGVDYYSRYIDIVHLQRLTSKTVIAKMKNWFAGHGIPEVVISDNGTQFSSSEFQSFAEDWNFQHITTSPHYPQANGAAERAVHTAKDILKQADVFKALLAYHTTPIPEPGASPAELALSRKPRTTLPVHPRLLLPRLIDRDTLLERDIAFKSRQKTTFDRHHGVQPLPTLLPGDPVRIKLDGEKGWKQPAVVVEPCARRSYLLRTPEGGELRHNRHHIRDDPTSRATASSPPAPAATAADSGACPIPGPPQDQAVPETPSVAEPDITPAPVPSPGKPPPAQFQTCSGRAIVKPAGFRSKSSVV